MWIVETYTVIKYFPDINTPTIKSNAIGRAMISIKFLKKPQLPTKTPHPRSTNMPNLHLFLLWSWAYAITFNQYQSIYGSNQSIQNVGTTPNKFIVFLGLSPCWVNIRKLTKDFIWLAKLYARNIYVCMSPFEKKSQNRSFIKTSYVLGTNEKVTK